MRKLLNTIYVTSELAYLSLDGENLVCKLENSENFRIPFENVEAIVCFNYIGCSPALMGKCAENLIPISFISPTGRFLAKVSGETRGNVFLRVSQIDQFRNSSVCLAQNTIAAKIFNSLQLIKRSMHDIPSLRTDCEIQSAVDSLKSCIDSIYKADSIDKIIGIEGNCAHNYFSIFNKLITNEKFEFIIRSKRPPLDMVNATLSFVYTIYTNEFAAALETVGLDSFIGFCHSLRSGRSSLACDLIEESRCIAERFVLTMINIKILNESDYEKQISGAVLLNDVGRKKVITHWQEKKRTDIVHPYLNQKIQLGLLPYIQSNLLAKYIRGDISEYPCFLMKY